jgi:hypothetical protein
MCVCSVIAVAMLARLSVNRPLLPVCTENSIQGWRTFLSNHVDGIAAIDLFVLPTIAF